MNRGRSIFQITSCLLHLHFKRTDLIFQARDSLFGIPARGFFGRKVRRHGLRRLDLGFKCPGFLDQARELLLGADASRFFLCHARRRLFREGLLLLGFFMGGADGGLPLGILRGNPRRQIGGANGRLHFCLLLELYPGGVRFQSPGFFFHPGNLFLGGEPGGFLLGKPLGGLADLLLLPLCHAAGNPKGFLLPSFLVRKSRIEFSGTNGRLGLGLIPNPFQHGFFFGFQGQQASLGLLLANMGFRQASFGLCFRGGQLGLPFGFFLCLSLRARLLRFHLLASEFHPQSFLRRARFFGGEALGFGVQLGLPLLLLGACTFELGSLLGNL